MGWIGDSVDLSDPPKTIEELLAEAQHGQVVSPDHCDGSLGWEDFLVEPSDRFRRIVPFKVLKKCKGCRAEVEIPVAIDYVWHKLGCENPGDLELLRTSRYHTETARGPKRIMHEFEAVLQCRSCGCKAKLNGGSMEECDCDEDISS